MPTTAALKRCSKCGEDKPTDDGRRWRWNKCPDCVKEYQGAYHQKWYLANRDKVLEGISQWQKENPEKVAENTRRYQQAHPEKMAEKTRRYQQAHPEKMRAKNKLRTAMKASACCEHGKGCVPPKAEIATAQIGCCYWCGAPLPSDYHIDHIYPLSRRWEGLQAERLRSLPTMQPAERGYASPRLRSTSTLEVEEIAKCQFVESLTGEGCRAWESCIWVKSE